MKDRIEAAKASTTIDAPAERVWTAMTTPDLLREYFFGADVQSTWTPGDPITFSGSYEGKPYEDKGVVLESKPRTALSFTHWSALSGVPDTPENYHIVTMNLDGRNGATTVTLVQENLDGKAVSTDTRRNLEKNWNALLDGLKTTVESKTPVAKDAKRST